MVRQRRGFHVVPRKSPTRIVGSSVTYAAQEMRRRTRRVYQQPGFFVCLPPVVIICAVPAALLDRVPHRAGEQKARIGFVIVASWPRQVVAGSSLVLRCLRYLILFSMSSFCEQKQKATPKLIIKFGLEVFVSIQKLCARR